MPHPGGPQKMIDGRWPDSRMRRSGRPGPRMRSWPTYSSRDRGLIRSARGSRMGPAHAAARRLSRRLWLRSTGSLIGTERTTRPLTRPPPFVFHIRVEGGGGALRHHCGIVGISSDEEVNIPELLFYGLFSLQHRGQESAGIAYSRRGSIRSYRDVGMVTHALSHYLTESHPSRLGIGHVRYSTHGTNKLENAQPIVVSCNKGEISLAHNGNISNSEALQAGLIEEGSIFQSTTDTELLLHMIARSPRRDFMKPCSSASAASRAPTASCSCTRRS